MIQVKLHKVNIAIENEKKFHIFEQSIFKRSNFAMKNMLLPWMKLSWVYILIIPICHWSLLNGKERLSLNKLKLHNTANISVSYKHRNRCFRECNIL